MSKRVLAKNGNSMFVVELDENVFALVNTDTDTCLFSRTPNPFYARGRFEKASVSTSQIQEIKQTLHKTEEEITPDNFMEYCLGGISYEQLKEVI